MNYEYKCPSCAMIFSSGVKNGIVECPNCNENLDAVNGEKVYICDGGEDENCYDEDDYEDDYEDNDEEEGE